MIDIRYLGNKTRLASYLCPILTEHLTGENWYIEPFGGALGMISNVNYPKRIAYDKDKYIIALMEAVRDGWVPPTELSEEDYQWVKRDAYQDYSLLKKSGKKFFVSRASDELIAFAGYGCSFGGKWFGGFARGGTKLMEINRVTT